MRLFLPFLIALSLAGLLHAEEVELGGAVRYQRIGSYELKSNESLGAFIDRLGGIIREENVSQGTRDSFSYSISVYRGEESPKATRFHFGQDNFVAWTFLLETGDRIEVTKESTVPANDFTRDELHFPPLKFMIPQKGAPLLIAHRGDSAAAPENTMASIRSAVEAGAAWIEFDVRQTQDDALVLFHDQDLARFGAPAATIETMQLGEVQRLNVGHWLAPGVSAFSKESPPTLRDAIVTCLKHGVTPLIERKSGEAADYVKLIRELKVEEAVVIQAFDWKFLLSLKSQAPSIRLGALGGDTMERKHRIGLRLLRPQWIAWNHKHLDQEDVAYIHQLGAKAAAWTVNDEEVARKLIDWNIDGIITDRPGDLIKFERAP